MLSVWAPSILPISQQTFEISEDYKPRPTWWYCSNQVGFLKLSFIRLSLSPVYLKPLTKIICSCVHKTKHTHTHSTTSTVTTWNGSQQTWITNGSFICRKTFVRFKPFELSLNFQGSFLDFRVLQVDIDLGVWHDWLFVTKKSFGFDSKRVKLWNRTFE